jgi:tRNA1Val (adenine37-N6)-methyltransferase
MAFRFRRFTVEDTQSTLRVGTDAMLLGSWASPGMAKKILDIGTGCGVLALMMAQKCDACIEAIEIDHPSVTEAGNNFLNSPWPSRIRAIDDSLQSFSARIVEMFDFIITNPPYFSRSLKSPSPRMNQARHDESLSLPELARLVSRMLAPDGCFATILPVEPADRFQMICAENGLYPLRRLVVYPKPGARPKRILTEFVKGRAGKPDCSALTILDATGLYTPEYLELTKYFHNF